MDIESIKNNKNKALENIENYLNKCILSDSKHQKKANLISYWLKDYINYLSNEEAFNSSNLKHYNRGDVIKVNLGFNIGNELGGLHYCIVLDKINAKSYSTLTIVPLSSVKPNKKIHNSSVYLGNELFIALKDKCKALLEHSKDRAISAQEKLTKYYNENILFQPEPEDFKALQEFNIAIKIADEIKQMKTGSIALVNQITTISKQRIYNPKNDLDILSGIKISKNNLDSIDKKIAELFLKK